MELFSLMLSAALLAAPDAAPAADPPVAQPAPAATPARAPADKVCTRQKPVGSNRPVRVCRDRVDAAREGEAAREAMERAQQDHYQPPGT